MASASEQLDSRDCGAGARMTDFILVAWVSALIGMARMKWMLGRGQRWKRDEKLRLLFAGYNGTRNTGSDVRVNEMLHQIRHVLGAENVDFSVMTQDFGRTKGYFDGTRQVHLPDVFPPMLYREVGKSHGVIACEGSMFKSKFANALTTMMIGSLGLASAENKLSVGYGGEAGHMDPLIRNMCARYVSESLVITRNTESQSLLHSLGIKAELGTDTAWTFKPHPQEYAQKVLRVTGWNGKTPILVICPIHPFVWPVKASIAKYVARVTTGAYKESQYRTVYFHESGREVDRKFQSVRFGNHERDQIIFATPSGVSDSGSHGKAGCRGLPRNCRANSGHACFYFRRLRHVPDGFHFTRVYVHGFFAISRHRDVHAQPGGLRGRDHGRAYSKPNARARARAFAFDGGRSRAGAEIIGNHGDAGARARRGARRNRAHRGSQPEDDGTHGSFIGGCGAPAISGISSALRRIVLGRLFAAAG